MVVPLCPPKSALFKAFFFFSGFTQKVEQTTAKRFQLFFFFLRCNSNLEKNKSSFSSQIL